MYPDSSTSLCIQIDSFSNRVQLRRIIKGAPDSSIIFTEIPVRFKNGAVVLYEERELFRPFFPLFWGPGGTQQSLFLLKDGSIAESYRSAGVAIFVIVPFFAAEVKRDLVFTKKGEGCSLD
jgi:hypothetical protein